MDRRTPYDMLEEANQSLRAGFPGLAAVLREEAERRIRIIEYKQRLKEAEQEAEEFEDE